VNNVAFISVSLFLCPFQETLKVTHHKKQNLVHCKGIIFVNDKFGSSFRWKRFSNVKLSFPPRVAPPAHTWIYFPRFRPTALVVSWKQTSMVVMLFCALFLLILLVKFIYNMANSSKSFNLKSECRAL
jgi:hypothetical protein